MVTPHGLNQMTSVRYKEVYTLGSLFDGSGGFPLAGVHTGFNPVWASEIEPFPIRVTTARFPSMVHLGDVSKVDGAKIEPVDVITFSSPCQNLAICGNRTGLKGEQSRLFFEAIRIIKEMRNKTNDEYPKYVVWENVKNSLSSSQGADFQIVLQSICEIAEQDQVSVPRSDKWRKAGCILGNGYSVAWRVLDSQYWGVPQRRERVFLVADLRGQRAGQILFNSEGVSGDSGSNESKRQEIADSDRRSIKKASNAIVVENHGMDDRYKVIESGVFQTLSRMMGTGGNNTPLVIEEPIILTASKTDYMTVFKEGPAGALVATDYKDPPTIYRDKVIRRITPLECCRLQGFPDHWCDDLVIENPTPQQLYYWSRVWAEWNKLNDKKPKTENQVKKWLATPPTDAAQYKMWGNGVALPCVEFILESIRGALDKEQEGSMCSRMICIDMKAKYTK